MYITFLSSSMTLLVVKFTIRHGLYTVETTRCFNYEWDMVLLAENLFTLFCKINVVCF